MFHDIKALEAFGFCTQKKRKERKNEKCVHCFSSFSVFARIESTEIKTKKENKNGHQLKIAIIYFIYTFTVKIYMYSF
jgi:hypothetical protein